jgi:biopolymer transport protein ExbB/TolQ
LRVASIVLGEALFMASVGLATGIPATLAASRVLETFKFQINRFDPLF